MAALEPLRFLGFEVQFHRLFAGPLERIDLVTQADGRELEIVGSFKTYQHGGVAGNQLFFAVRIRNADNRRFIWNGINPIHCGVTRLHSFRVQQQN